MKTDALARGLPRLHVVTDDVVLAGPGFGVTAAALLRCGGGAIALHVRGPGLSGREIWRRAEGLAGVARETGATLLINDRIDIALAFPDIGAHVGIRSLEVADARRLLGDRLLGASAHGVDAAVDVVQSGADLVVVGAIWETRSHPTIEPAGETLLRRVRRALDAVGRAAVPVVAIGGVSPQRVSAALGAGAAGVAVLSGVWAAPDPVEAVSSYLTALAEADGSGAAAEV